MKALIVVEWPDPDHADHVHRQLPEVAAGISAVLNLAGVHGATATAIAAPDSDH